MTTASDGAALEPVSRGRWPAIAVALATIAMSVLLVAPRAAPFIVLMLLAAVAAGWQPLRRDEVRTVSWPAPLTAALLLGGYLLCSTLWSADPLQGLGKAALFLALVAGLVVGWLKLPHVPGNALARLATALIVAFTVALAYLLFEELTSHLLKRTLFNLLPSLRPDPKHARIEDDLVRDIALYVSNRNMAAVNFVLWPVLLGCTILMRRSRATLACALLWILAAEAMRRSQHETSVIALLAALSVFALARVWPRIALGVVAAGWITATMLVVPIVAHAYTAQAYTDMRLPLSARHRIILWGYTAEQVPKRFWRGVGIDSTKPLDAAHRYEQPPGHSYPRRTGTHSHNVYLQTWYELGAIGAVLLLAFGLAVIAGIRRLEERLQPYALAAFTTSAAIAGFSWGMWQPWFMAAFAISALLLLLMAELSRRRDGPA